MEQIGAILLELQELLTRYGYAGQARYVSSLVNSREGDEVWDAVSGPEFWGGAGAIWEVEPFDASHPDDQAAKADFRRFGEQLVALAQLVNTRQSNPRAVENAELVVRWATRP